MRIVIDMQGAQTESRFRGIGRYTLALAQAMVRNRGEHEIILALSGLFPKTIEPIRATFDGLLSQKNIRVWHALGPVREGEPNNACRREVAELIREAFLASLEPDVVHISSLFEGYVDDAVTSIGRFDQATPVSISLYDLIPLLNPNHYFKPNPVYEQYYLRKVDHLRRASLLLAISESSRLEGLAHLGVPEENVVNVSGAADAHFRPVSVSDEQAQALQRKFGLSRPFVLYAGGADERKNLPRLISAYARLSPELRKSHHLVFAGSIHQSELPFLKHSAKLAGLGKDELILTGYVSDDELVKLYNLCKLFVFPSWHEGFGIPALEAMACGRAVIGSNVSSLPEVIGYKDALFDPFSEQSICNKIAQALTDDAFRVELTRHGLEQAKQFSWDISAQRAIFAIECLIEKKSKRLIHVLYRSVDDITSKLIRQISNLLCQPVNEEVLISLAQAIASSIPRKLNERQLMIDISELVQRDAKSGIQRVVRSILHEWLYNPPPNFCIEPVYATVDRNGYRYARRFISQFLNCVDNTLVDEPVEFKAGDIFLGLDLQPQVVPAQREFYQELRRNGVQIRFVVYDLLCVLMPHFFIEGAAEAYSRWLEVVGQSDGAICISKAVADELTTWFEEHGLDKSRSFNISWFPLGGNIQNTSANFGLPSDAAFILEALQNRISFLMVGTLEPRKGHAQVLGAFEYLWEQDIQINLVIVGKQGWMAETLVKQLCNHFELGKRLFWLNGISDDYLEKIYDASTCLIAASEGEGFGLPLVEAAQHKVSIIARDLPVFREVAGDHAYYFSGLTPNDIARAVETWLNLYQTKRHPTSDAMPWLNWRESAMNLQRIICGNQ